MGGPAKLSEFYSKLRVIKDRHRKHPNARVADVGSGLRTKEMREELEKSKSGSDLLHPG